jgi:hypothetical protein
VSFPPDRFAPLDLLSALEASGVGADVLEAMASHLLGQFVFLMEGVDGTALRSLLRKKALPSGPLTMTVAMAVMRKLGVRRSAHLCIAYTALPRDVAW